MAEIMNPQYPFGHLAIVPSLLLSERVQVRFPRSKRTRIRRKWAKRAKNWRTVPMDRCVVVAGNIHVHPAKMKELTDALSGRIQSRMEVLLVENLFEKQARAVGIPYFVPEGNTSSATFSELRLGLVPRPMLPLAW
ncbi:MAG: hypothetical protein WC107_06085 [Patescibacteria group bacterium]